MPGSQIDSPTLLTAAGLDLLGLAARRAVAYLQSVPARAVAPSEAAVRGLARFAEPLPQGPSDPREVIDLLDRIGSPATVATEGGRYFGFVNGAALPASIAATWMAAAWDQNASLR